MSTIAMILSALEALSRDLLSRQCSPSPSHSEGISITLGPQEERSSKWGKAGTRKRSISRPTTGDGETGRQRIGGVSVASAALLADVS